MLNITDLSLLKIKKVKEWAIYFDYADDHYFIHGVCELGEGSGQELYKRRIDQNGHWELSFIASKWFVNDQVSYDYIKKQKGNTIVYKNIDKEYFAYKLTKRGFAIGIMEDRVKREEKRIGKLENQIRELREKIYSLESELREIK